MKKSTLVIVAFVASALTLSSCSRNKNTDPAPVYPTNNTIDLNSTNLRFTSDTIVADSIGTFNIPATSSSNSLSVTIIPDTNISITNSGVSVSYTKKHSSFYGYSKVSVSVSDGTNTISKNLVVKVGTDAQIKTYNILKPYFNKITSLVLINEDSYIHSSGQSNFYASTSTYSYYKILPNGNLGLCGSDFKHISVVYTVSNTSTYAFGAYGIFFANTIGKSLNSNEYNFTMYLSVENLN